MGTNMLKTRKVLFVIVMAAILLVQLSSAAYSEEKYPNKTIQIIVPFGPGGSSDLFFRSLTEEMQKVLKVPVTVTNKTGASGLVGADFVANSKNDGYILLGTATSPITLAPAIDPKDARELDSVAILANQASIIVTRSESNFKSIEDVIKQARQTPGVLTCGTSGIATEPFFDLELFKAAEKIDIRHVPISSSSEGATATLGGHIDFWFGSVSTVQSLMRAGRLRGLGVCTSRRLESFPDVPTFAEKGYPQVNVNLVITLMGPKGLPKDVLKTWEDALKVVMRSHEVVASIKKLNYDIDLQTGSMKINAYLKEELERFSKIAKEVGTRK